MSSTNQDNNPTLSDSVSPAVPTPRPGPTSRTRIAQVATKLQSELETTNAANNSGSHLNTIRIDVTVLLTLFKSFLYPYAITFARYLNIQDPLNIGAPSIVKATHTLATYAITAMYSVLFHKATKANLGNFQLFGSLPIDDHNEFISLISLFVNSIGPIQLDSQPYRCTFIPYIVNTSVQALYLSADYDTVLGESFRLTLLRNNKQASLTPIDVHNNTSSSWWMLYPVQADNAAGTPVTVTTYNPVPYGLLDHATTLAALLLPQPLYSLPGPIITTVIGPFVSSNPTKISDIPANFRDAIHFNTHVPAYYAIFNLLEPVPDNATLTCFKEIQDDDKLITSVNKIFLNPSLTFDEYARKFNERDNILSKRIEILSEYIDNATETGNQPPVTLTVDEPKKTTRATTSGKRTADDTRTQSQKLIDLTLRAPEIPDSIDFVNPNDNPFSAGYQLYSATILYFDHVLTTDFNIARRNLIITQVNTPTH